MSRYLYSYKHSQDESKKKEQKHGAEESARRFHFPPVYFLCITSDDLGGALAEVYTELMIIFQHIHRIISYAVPDKWIVSYGAFICITLYRLPAATSTLKNPHFNPDLFQGLPCQGDCASPVLSHFDLLFIIHCAITFANEDG